MEAEMIEAQKHHVRAICNDGTSVEGFISLLGDRKLHEVVNNPAEIFLCLNEAEVTYPEQIESFKLATKRVEVKDNFFLNKSAVKCIEDVGA
jgi:hypothetical protein